MSEQSSLLAEISALEARISSLEQQGDQELRGPQKKQRLDQHQAGEGDEDELTAQLRVLLRANDSELLALHPQPASKETEDDAVAAEELKREQELVASNAAFTGIVFSETSNRLLTSTPTHQTRLHTLVGTLPSPTVPLAFRVELRVREPALVLPESGTDGGTVGRQSDPGSEYEVVAMDARVWGGGNELQAIVDCLRLTDDPNPPALFTALRQYSLLANQRAQTLEGLRTDLSRWIMEDRRARPKPTGKGKGKAPAEDEEDDANDATASSLVFSHPSGTLTLRLAYILSPAPSLSLVPSFTPDLPASTQKTLEKIPVRFEEMVREGFDVREVVGALVLGAFGED